MLPILVGAYYLHPPEARAIFLHNDLPFDDTCPLIGGEHNVLWGGGTNGNDPRNTYLNGQLLLTFTASLELCLSIL